MADVWDDFDYGEAEACGVLALRLVCKLMQSPELRPLLLEELRQIAAARPGNSGIEHRVADQAKRLLLEGEA